MKGEELTVSIQDHGYFCLFTLSLKLRLYHTFQRTHLPIHTPTTDISLARVHHLNLGFSTERVLVIFIIPVIVQRGRKCEIERRGKVIWKASGCSSVKITALKSCEILFYLARRRQTFTFCRVIGKIRALGFKGWRCAAAMRVSPTAEVSHRVT